MELRKILIGSLFLLGMVSIDLALGNVLDHLLPRVLTGEAIGFVNQTLLHKDSGVIIFGSSRARHHIDPAILEGDLQLSVYNAGCDGQGIAYARMVQALLLRRGTMVKLFVLHVDVTDFMSGDLSPGLSLAPYWGEDPSVDEILVRSTDFARLKFQSSLFRFNSKAIPLLANLAVKPEEEGANGFVALRGSISNPEEIATTGTWIEMDPNKMDEYKLSLYRDFLRAARDHGIRTLVLAGPRFWPTKFKSDPRAALLSQLAAITEEEHTPFLILDGRSAPEFLNPELYFDVAHLNVEGASIFSRRLSIELSKQLNQ